MFLSRAQGEPLDRWQDLDDFDKPWWDAFKGRNTREDPPAKDSSSLKSVRELWSFVRENEYIKACVFPMKYHMYL